MDATGDSLAIDDLPALAEAAARVLASGEPCELTRDGTPVARIVPARQPARPEPTAAGREAFANAAGSWADVNVEQFLAAVYAHRDMGIDRAPLQPAPKQKMKRPPLTWSRVETAFARLIG